MTIKNLKVYLPKMINMIGFISYYIPWEFKLSTSDNFFNFQILGFEDNGLIGTSLFKLQIVGYKTGVEIQLNILFLFHLKIEYDK